MLMKQYDAAKMDESKDAAIIQVVEPAIEPDRKSSPRRAMILLISAFLGFLAGCILVLLLWWKKLGEIDPIAGKRLQELSNALWGKRAQSPNL